MALNHKALFTWFMLLVFFVLLVVRLDDKVSWNWFIIFIPMWVFDVIILIYIIVFMIRHCKNGCIGGSTMQRKVWCLLAMILKLAFQVLLCVRLEYLATLAIPVVFVPGWLLLLGLFIDVTHSLSAIWRRTAT